MHHTTFQTILLLLLLQSSINSNPLITYDASSKKYKLKPSSPVSVILQPPTCATNDTNKRIANPLNLNQFYICDSGRSTLMACPSTLVFNKFTLRCDTSKAKPEDPCASSPCLNESTCTPNASGYSCLCREGFTGDACETVDACREVDCGPEGSCLAGPGFTVCLCYEEEFMSRGNCSDIDRLQLNPCVLMKADGKSFESGLWQQVFVQCVGLRPELKVCPYPLVFSQESDRCDWPVFSNIRK